MSDQERADHELDAVLKRAFAEADTAAAPGARSDAAFQAGVSAGVAKVERARRGWRIAGCVAFALVVLAVTPLVVQLTLALAVAALTPAGVLTAMILSLCAAGFVLRRTLA